MFEICDILCPPMGRYREGGAAVSEFYEKLRRNGCELWFYSCGGGPTSNDAIAYYRAQQWECWRAKATGTAFWSYGDAGKARCSWNAFTAVGEIYAPVYIDSNSITDGKHWLAVIEGVRDFEYLRLLSARVSELKNAGQATRTAAAEELLRDLPTSVVDAALNGDLDTCDAGRIEVLDALAALRP